MIYEYIHRFNMDNEKQDWYIAHVPTLRRIIFEAMKYQAVYLTHVGNLYYSTKPEEREIAIDEIAKSKLSTTAPELGISILYGGSI